VSYTVETLRAIAESQPAAELFFLMGADTLRDLPNWREPGEVLRLATPLVVRRPGEPAPEASLLAGVVSGERLAQIAATAPVEMPPTDISSSVIRARLADGEACDQLLSEPVERYAVEHRCYER
ncbi:MAG: nicotinate-nicotinamide nucleotide adenylyltransferase, partial [Planctomycetota bacterium]